MKFNTWGFQSRRLITAIHKRYGDSQREQRKLFDDETNIVVVHREKSNRRSDEKKITKIVMYIRFELFPFGSHVLFVRFFLHYVNVIDTNERTTTIFAQTIEHAEKIVFTEIDIWL